MKIDLYDFLKLLGAMIAAGFPLYKIVNFTAGVKKEQDQQRAEINAVKELKPMTVSDCAECRGRCRAEIEKNFETFQAGLRQDFLESKEVWFRHFEKQNETFCTKFSALDRLIRAEGRKGDEQREIHQQFRTETSLLLGRLLQHMEEKNGK